MDMELQLARWRLGLIESHELPALATRMVASGQESPRLAELAGLDLEPFDPRDATDVWQAVLTELDIEVPTVDESILIVGRNIAKRIVGGELDPIDGAEQILEIDSLGPSPQPAFQAFDYPVRQMSYYSHKERLSLGQRRRGIARQRRRALEAARQLIVTDRGSE